MKKFLRIALCLSLVLVCVFSMMTVASAATVTQRVNSNGKATGFCVMTSSYVFRNKVYLYVTGTSADVPELTISGCGNYSIFPVISSKKGVTISKNITKEIVITTPAWYKWATLNITVKQPVDNTNPYSYVITCKNADKFWRTK